MTKRHLSEIDKMLMLLTTDLTNATCKIDNRNKVNRIMIAMYEMIYVIRRATQLTTI